MQEHRENGPTVGVLDGLPKGVVNASPDVHRLVVDHSEVCLHATPNEDQFYVGIAEGFLRDVGVDVR